MRLNRRLAPDVYLGVLDVVDEAGDPVAGKALSATCVACHGVNGISPNPTWPNLAGQKEQYLIKQLTALRDGERQNELMTPIAMNLSEMPAETLRQIASGLLEITY